MTVRWEKRKTGWGTTEYVAEINGTRYVTRRTGAQRYGGWEVREDAWPLGERVVLGNRMRSVMEIAEAKLKREGR